MEFLPAFGRAGSVLDTLLQMGTNQLFAEGFQGPPGGNDLHQYIGTICFRLHHFFKRFNLALDAAKAHDEGSLFQTGTDVLDFHGQTFAVFPRAGHRKMQSGSK